jgi:hypothetical protein
MAQTSQLATADSLLANVQLAFTGADETPPSITTQSGRLGGQLGDTILALGGVVGPLTFHLAAESVLVFAQTADPAPTFVAHPSPHWALGGHDAQLGVMEPGFTGADDPGPTITVQTGRLGRRLGDVVLGLDGVVGPRTFCMTAESVLAIAQTAATGPTFVAHASPHWTLGGHDSQLGGMELAFAGAAAPRPLTGTRTGKLGTVYSLLGGVRLALGEQEGEALPGVEVTAESVLSLSSEAAVGIVRSRAATSTLDLVATAGRNNLLAATAESTISLDTTAAFAVARAVAAENTLELTDEAGRNNLLDASAENTLELTDAAGRNNLLTGAAESTISADVTVAAAAVRLLAAESVLELTDEAESAALPLFAESELSLDTTAAFTVARAVAAESILDLVDEAGRNNLLNASAESTVELTVEAERNNLLDASAESILILTTEAGRNNLLSASAESTLSLTATAATGRPLSAAGTSELELTDEATVLHLVPVLADAWDWLPLWDQADVVVVRALSAQNTIELAQSEHTARPWYVSANTPVQTIELVYDAQADDLVEQITGLDVSAAVARPLTASAQHSISLSQSASVYKVKPTAIEVSAESVLELLGEVGTRNQTGEAGNWLLLSQNASVDRCRVAKSALDLTTEAAVLLNVSRGAASALNLRQAAAYSIVFGGVLQQYNPFVGAGAAGSPTPPPMTIGPTEHTPIPFRLFYPAEGVVTDSLTLRAPNLGNKDRLSFNRILRETRGGTLIVFADPIWPKIQTLVLTFSGLRSVQTQQLLTFLDAHLGEEIGLLDWEGRVWKGIITSPTDPVVQDGRDSFSASMEFEGELVPA